MTFDIYPVTMSRHQIAFPAKLMRKFNIKDGDKLLILDKDGKLTIALKEEYLAGLPREKMP